MEEVEVAVLVRGACKRYKGDEELVLDNLNMTVVKGSIYGLLGSSGSGKTTLLGAIIGGRKLQAGTISILEEPPSHVPTRAIGYMPQDLCLIEEFTVKDALQHQGWLFGMSDRQIDDRFNFLKKLLDLPPGNKLVKNLSGGEQRRVSLATALVHDPDLLLLDEPTVGLDPVLRRNVWDYLIKIAREDKKTIIITTHYIEECKDADRIGLLRNGKILAEGNPNDLLEEFNCDSIENLFILLSTRQEEGNLHLCSQNYNVISAHKETRIFSQIQPRKRFWDKLHFTNRSHAKALLMKNFIRFRRHEAILPMAFFFPVIQIAAFFVAIGPVPNDIKLGIVNEELGRYSNCTEYALGNLDRMKGALNENQSCIYEGLGCQYVDLLGDLLKKNQVYYKSKDEAMAAIRKGDIHHFIYFPSNYSESVTLVRGGYGPITDEDFDFQEINVYRDVIDPTLGSTVEAELTNTYERFAEKLAVDCHKHKNVEKLPVVFNKPVYGGYDYTYTDFVAPGMLSITIIYLALLISQTTIVTEKTEGVWERTILSGVTPVEILVFHAITICFIVIVQILELGVLTFYFFNLKCNGNLFQAILLLFFQSQIGVSLGIFLSVIAKTEAETCLMGMGITFPLIFLSGYFWPLEGMPTYLRYFAYITPATYSVESLNNIVFKGWSISHFEVYKGFLTSSGFTLFFTILSILCIKYEKK